ncbi:glycoside hydrolase family 18 protein [Apiospora aurea]|uniref:Glycoside hydrolase family 18 protein n=1 Tax=Apiospora aurea TaxID=335848 RepID=A0ABR1QEY0_9PEZI
MVLSVRLRDVLIALDGELVRFPALEEEPLPQFPNLTNLGLMDAPGIPYNLDAMRALLEAAPKLKNIFACNGRRGERWDGHDRLAWHREGNPHEPLVQLKKLVVSDMYPVYLGDFLYSISDLEELEYYWQIFPRASTELGAIIKKTQATLKRLCFSFLPWPAWHLGPEPWFWYDLVDANVAPIESLAEFPKLEDITIDYRSLCRENQEDEYERLTRFLPKTIRRLRISYVVCDMTKSLSHLAGTAKDDFSELSSVVVGVPKWPDGTPDHLEVMRAKVASLFEDKGIDFGWRLENFGPEAHTIIPGATKPDLTPIPWKEEDESAM